MRIVGDLNLSNLLEATKFDAMEQTHVASVAKVVQVHSDRGTVDVNLVMRPEMNKLSKVLNKFKDEDEKKPIVPTLKDIPILMSHCTRPLYRNDNVLVIFNDFDYYDWYKSDNYMDYFTRKKHSINNAIAIAGIDNLVSNSFKTPEGYRPPVLPNSLCDSPFDRYGYDNENACLRFANGDVRAGVWGVNITSRDSTDVNTYAENGSINFFPSVKFAVNTGTVHLEVTNDNTCGKLAGLPEVTADKNHRITMYSTAVSKKITETDENAEELEAQGLKDGDKVYTSDIYRILRYMRANIAQITRFIGGADFGSKMLSGHCDQAGQSAIEFGQEFEQNLNELGIRIDGLFAPADPIQEEEEK